LKAGLNFEASSVKNLDRKSWSAALLNSMFDRFATILTLDNINGKRYYSRQMIRSFADRGTLRVFQRLRAKHFSADLQRTAYRKLLLIDTAGSIHDLRVPPGNRLEKIAGKREGQYSIRINEQWRICFAWKSNDAFNVEITDYHD
jgi:proteic killer suppression protein